MLGSAAALDVRPMTRLFRALSDENRLRMVALLTQGELCVCHLETALGLTQTNVSRHLGVLRAAGLVDSRRKHSWVYYRLVEQDEPGMRRLVAEVTRSLSAARLRSDLVRLKRSIGPEACK
jgi:ArsR family transcriptional regulator